MSRTNGSVKAILYALAANLGIALAKGFATRYTRSGAMLAESIHSFADTVNQILLLVGLRRAKRPVSEDHPLGYGRAIYFWSFIVAVMLFRFRQSRQIELIVVVGEDIAALLGLSLALVAVLTTILTGNPLYDSLGTIAIGAVFVLVAVVVGIEVKSLLIGESADPETVSSLRDFIAARPEVADVYKLITLQLGTGLMVSVKVGMQEKNAALQLIEDINRVEAAFKTSFPQAGWIFAEPDVHY